MRVNSIGQEKTHRHNSKGVLQAGVIGAIGGAVVRNFAPLTAEEHDVFLSSSKMKEIGEIVKNARKQETEVILDEIKNNKLSVSKEVAEKFASRAFSIANNPKTLPEYLKTLPQEVKGGVSGLAARVIDVGNAAKHTEINNIKNAAKASRPLTYFIAIGALVAMSGKLIVNAFKSCLPAKETKKTIKAPKELTMADVLLDGLGSNTEVLFLTSKQKDKK